jgi:hypothetical protein
MGLLMARRRRFSMPTPQTNAVDYYRQADEVADHPGQATRFRDLAALFEKEAREFDGVLNAVPDPKQGC